MKIILHGITTRQQIDKLRFSLREQSDSWLSSGGDLAVATPTRGSIARLNLHHAPGTPRDATRRDTTVAQRFRKLFSRETFQLTLLSSATLSLFELFGSFPVDSRENDRVCPRWRALFAAAWETPRFL